jgi:transcriptional antiterminator RfaH
MRAQSASMPAPVAAEIIANLRQRESAGAFDELAPAQRLRAGDRVRILEGPFENCLGRLVAASDQERVFILFELLGRTVRAEVSTAAIEAA